MTEIPSRCSLHTPFLISSIVLVSVFLSIIMPHDLIFLPYPMTEEIVSDTIKPFFVGQYLFLRGDINTTFLPFSICLIRNNVSSSRQQNNPSGMLIDTANGLFILLLFILLFVIFFIIIMIIIIANIIISDFTNFHLFFVFFSGFAFMAGSPRICSLRRLFPYTGRCCTQCCFRTFASARSLLCNAPRTVSPDSGNV